MLFIETEIFTEDVKKLLDDDEYRRLQIFLAIQPDCGDLIQETGGPEKGSLESARERKTWRCEDYLLSSNQTITNSIVADLSERDQG